METAISEISSVQDWLAEGGILHPAIGVDINARWLKLAEGCSLPIRLSFIVVVTQHLQSQTMHCIAT